MGLSGRSLIHLACVIAGLLPFALLDDASADEAGVSFWLQGQFGSFAAVPSNPGWSFESAFYHDGVRRRKQKFCAWWRNSDRDEVPQISSW